MENSVFSFKNKYEEVHGMADAGERLFALHALEREIDNKKKAQETENERIYNDRGNQIAKRSFFAGSAGTALAMAVLLPTGPFIAVAAGCAVIGMVGGIMAATLSLPVIDLIDMKENQRRMSELSGLTDIYQQVVTEKYSIIQQEPLKNMAASSRYEDALYSFPELRGRFDAAAKREAEKPEVEAMRRTILKEQDAPSKPSQPPKAFGI